MDTRRSCGQHGLVIEEIPAVRDLRWPILVILDGLGEDEILDLEERVAERFALSDGVRGAIDPASNQPFLTQRLVQAMEDLYEADAIEADPERTTIRLTDAGRRLTEEDVVSLDAKGMDEPAQELRTQPEKPSVRDWAVATFYGLITRGGG